MCGPKPSELKNLLPDERDGPSESEYVISRASNA